MIFIALLMLIERLNRPFSVLSRFLSFMNKAITMSMSHSRMRKFIKGVFTHVARIYDNLLRLHKKRVQLLQDWFGTPTWPPFHCFGAPLGTLLSDNGNANENVAEK